MIYFGIMRHGSQHYMTFGIYNNNDRYHSLVEREIQMCDVDGTGAGRQAARPGSGGRCTAPSGKYHRTIFTVGATLRCAPEHRWSSRPSRADCRSPVHFWECSPPWSGSRPLALQYFPFGQFPRCGHNSNIDGRSLIHSFFLEVKKGS